MEPKKPTDRVAMRIASLIPGGGITGKCVQMFSVDRCMSVSDEVAITICDRTDGSNCFYISVPIEE